MIKQDGEVVFESEEEKVKIGSKDKGKKINSLEEKLKTCEKERKEYLDGWKRSKADAINEKTRLLQIFESERGNGKKEAIEEFLSVIDSITLAMQNTDDDGFKKVFEQVKDVVSSLGCILIDPKGEVFNPKEHEAIEEVEILEKNKDNVVIETIRLGCKIDDEVIRPAMVKVGSYKSK